MSFLSGGYTRVEYKDRTTSLDLLAPVLLMQSRTHICPQRAGECRLFWVLQADSGSQHKDRKDLFFGRGGKCHVTRHWSSEHTSTFTVMLWLSPGYQGQALSRANAGAHAQVQPQHGANSPLLSPAHVEEERSWNWLISQAKHSAKALRPKMQVSC